MAIQQWQIYHMLNCRHALPNPKHKYVAVAYVDIGIPHGFLINSDVNKYVRNNNNLFPCQAQILTTEHSFLRHDSWVDCQNLYEFTVSELTNLRGTLSEAAINYVLAAVQRCPVLLPAQKQVIVDQHNSR